MKPERGSWRSVRIILGAYLTMAFALASVRLAQGTGAWWTLASYAALLALLALTARATSGFQAWIGEWLPLLSLPVLYAAVPTTAVSEMMWDRLIQPIDRGLFGTDAAQTLAGTVPVRWISEVLHAAYLSYYAIIYLPPLAMQLRRDTEAFRRTVTGFTVAMVVCFGVFCVFPVEGPRYAWAAPPGIPDGIVRSVVVEILESGSSRGTAFPSSHQAIALVMSLSSLRWSRALGWPLMAATLLLGVGAVYGGFHYATDMLAGALVGLGSWWVAGRPAFGRTTAALG